jgi:hypothetical protein
MACLSPSSLLLVPLLLLQLTHERGLRRPRWRREPAREGMQKYGGGGRQHGADDTTAKGASPVSCSPGAADALPSPVVRV